MGIDRRLSSREIGQLLRQSASCRKITDGRIRIKSPPSRPTAQFLTEHVHRGLVEYGSNPHRFAVPIGVTTDRCIEITTGQNVGIDPGVNETSIHMLALPRGLRRPLGPPPA